MQLKTIIAILTVVFFLAATQTDVGTAENTISGILFFAGLAYVIFGKNK